MQKVSAALVKAQKAFGPALKTNTNPAFKSKYADLSACIEAVVDALNENGIALIQRSIPCDSGVCVETMFIHESGESLSSGPLHVPASKQDPQGYGSALTYARRYSLMAACGIAPEDDDGNAASKKTGPAVNKWLTDPDRPGWMADWLAAIDSAATTGECKNLTTQAIQAATAQNDSEAVDKFTAARDLKLSKAKKVA